MMVVVFETIEKYSYKHLPHGCLCLEIKNNGLEQMVFTIFHTNGNSIAINWSLRI